MTLDQSRRPRLLSRTLPPAPQMIALLAALLSVSASGCADLIDAQDCPNGGQARRHDGQLYCLYARDLIIEGFTCPHQMSQHPVPGGVVCAPAQTPPEGLPEPLQTPFEGQPPAWCIGQGCAAPQTPAPSPSPVELDQTFRPASRSSFERIYRHSSYACVVAADGQTQCAGPGFAPLEAALVRDGDQRWILNGVKRLALSQDMLCSVTGGPQFEGGVLRCVTPQRLGPILNTRMTFTDIALADDRICALGDYGAPLDRVQCNSVASDWLTHMTGAGMLNERLLKLDLGQGQDSCAITHCALTLGRQVTCAVTAMCDDRVSVDPYTLTAHVYQDVHHHAAKRVACALRDDNRSQTQPVDCWDLYSAQPIASPQGRFKALYSALCGLREDGRVVCWDDLHHERTPPQGPLTSRVILEDSPIDVAIHHDADELRWCALWAGNKVQCTPFAPRPR